MWLYWNSLFQSYKTLDLTFQLKKEETEKIFQMQTSVLKSRKYEIFLDEKTGTTNILGTASTYTSYIFPLFQD